MLSCDTRTEVDQEETALSRLHCDLTCVKIKVCVYNGTIYMCQNFLKATLEHFCNVNYLLRAVKVACSSILFKIFRVSTHYFYSLKKQMYLVISFVFLINEIAKFLLSGRTVPRSSYVSCLNKL